MASKATASRPPSGRFGGGETGRGSSLGGSAGTPNLYILDLGTQQLSRLTDGPSIDTEGTFIACAHISRVYNFFHVGTFRPDRIRSIADRFGVDGNMALENILYGKSF